MKRVLTAMLAMAMLITAAFGCSKPPAIEDTESNVIVQALSAGYGNEYWNAWARAFEAKNEGVTVTIVPDPSFLGYSAESKLQSGPRINQADILVPGTLNFRNIVERGKQYLVGMDYDCALEDLTSLYDEIVDPNVENDNQTVRKKMHPNYVDYFTINGKQYAFPILSEPNSFAYNADFFAAHPDWTIPRTTEEMKELVEKINATNEYTPFVWPGKVGYWNYPVMTWWAQYEGEEGMAQFWNGRDRYGELSSESFKQYGRYAAFKVMEDLVYGGKNSFDGSIDFMHNDAQMAFYNEDNKIAMLVTGGWLENEMKKSGYQPGDVNIGYMKVPVMSEVLKKEVVTESGTVVQVDRFTTIKDEQTLRTVISAIDENTGKPADISDADWTEMQKIRGYAYSTGLETMAVIPVYSNAKENAKKFLKFIASDEAIQIAYDTAQAAMPFYGKINRAEQETTFTKQKFDMVSDKIRYVSISDYTNPLFYRTDLKFFVESIETCIGNSSPTNKQTAKQYLDSCFEKVDSLWDSSYKPYAK